MVMRLNNSLLIFITSVFFISCVTTAGLKNNKSKYVSTGSKKVIVPQTKVIYQLDAKEPVISKYDRSYWLGIRERATSFKDKIFALLAAGEWDIAIDESRAYLLEHPKDKYALSALSISYMVKKQYNFAEYYAKLLEKTYGESALILNIKALCILLSPKLDMSKINQAIDLLSRSYESASDEIASGLNLSYLYLQIGDAQRAAAIFESLKSRCNNCDLSLIGAGISYSRLAQIEKAKSNFDMLLRQDPQNFYALYYLALIEYSHFKNISQAKTYLHKILTADGVTYADIQRKAQSLLRRIESEKTDTSSSHLATKSSHTDTSSPTMHKTIAEDLPLSSTPTPMFITTED